MRAALVAVALLAAGCGRSGSDERPQPVPPGRAAELLHERVWLDHLPRSMTDKFHVALFDVGGAGITQHRSVWKGDFELFFHEVDGGELAFVLPASGTEMRSTFHIVPITGHGEADLMLVIDHPPTGPREYLGLPAHRGHADVATVDAWLARRYPTRR